MDTRSLLVILFLVISVVGAYWSLPSNEFVNYDDNDYVTENSHVQAGLTHESILWAFTTGHTANWHPLTWLSHMLDCQLFGLNPEGHHVTSLLLHTLNTILLFLVLKRMTNALWQSAIVAALFALHPLHVESVAWVAERKDVLSSLFWMVTMWAYVWYVEHPVLTRYLAVALSFTLGLMAKPMLVTLPFVLLLLDYWPLGRVRLAASVSGRLQFVQAHAVNAPKGQKSLGTGHPQSQVLRLIWEKVPLIVLAATSSVVTVIVQKRIGAVLPLEVLPFHVRLGNALVSYVAYIAKMIWPSDLAVFYPHLGNALPVWHAVGAGVLLASLSVLGIREMRKRPYLAVGWLWYLGTLVPVIGLMQVGSQAMADRYTYIPLIGLSVAIAWGIPELIASWRKRKLILITLTGVVLCGFMVLTRSQVGYWRDSITLFSHAIEVTSNNWVAHINLANALREKQHRNKDAITHYSEAVRINPNYADAHYGLGVLMYEEGMIEESIAHSLNAVRLKPDYWQAHDYVGLAFSHQGLLDSAIVHYTEAIRLKPDYPDAHFNLGVAFHRMGELVKAIDQYSQALRLEPANAYAHSNLGAALHRQGRIKEAIAHYTEALRLKPDLTEARNNLQIALASQQQPKKP